MLFTTGTTPQSFTYQNGCLKKSYPYTTRKTDNLHCGHSLLNVHVGCFELQKATTTDNTSTSMASACGLPAGWAASNVKPLTLNTRETFLNKSLLLLYSCMQVARDEITCESCAINDIIICLRNFPNTLFRRYDILVSLSALLEW